MQSSYICHLVFSSRGCDFHLESEGAGLNPGLSRGEMLETLPTFPTCFSKCNICPLLHGFIWVSYQPSCTVCPWGACTVHTCSPADCKIHNITLTNISYWSCSSVAPLHQRPNNCRDSCSGVNLSISARLKLVDGVACRHYCWRRQLLEHRHITCFNNQSAHTDVICP